MTPTRTCTVVLRCLALPVVGWPIRGRSTTARGVLLSPRRNHQCEVVSTSDPIAKNQRGLAAGERRVGSGDIHDGVRNCEAAYAELLRMMQTNSDLSNETEL